MVQTFDGDLLKATEDSDRVWPFFRILIPAFLGEFPDRRSKLKIFATGGFWWSLPL